jgi:hypothetical protein
MSIGVSMMSGRLNLARQGCGLSQIRRADVAAAELTRDQRPGIVRPA